MICSQNKKNDLQKWQPLNKFENFFGKYNIDAWEVHVAH